MAILQTLIGLVTLQRLIELALSRRNAARLKVRGGIVVAPRHEVLCLSLQLSWLICLAVSVPAERQPHEALLAAFAALQLVRVWAIVSLGDNWTMEIIAIAEPPVAAGPYRYLRHPIDIAATAEIAALPLAFGAWQLAFLFTLFNAVLLTLRLRQEERVLAARALTPVTAADRMRTVR